MAVEGLPAGPVFLRFGREHMQPLREAIGNPCREVADARAREEAKARQDGYQAQVRRAAQEQAAKKAAEREARRPVCAGCGAKFTDERWKTAQATNWGPRRAPTRTCATTASRGPTPPRPRRPASRSTRNRYGTGHGSSTSSGMPVVPSAPAAVPSSPTNGGGRSSASAGAPPKSPGPLCARTATGRPSPTYSKPGRARIDNKSRARPCPSRRPAAPGSPASAGDATAPRLSVAAPHARRTGGRRALYNPRPSDASHWDGHGDSP
ncbi:hypothetical protein ACVW19_006933 [Streptomyces sp. TE5632]